MLSPQIIIYPNCLNVTSIDWGDGIGYGATHFYAKPGTYTVTITAKSDVSESATATIQVTVLPKDTSPGPYVMYVSIPNGELLCNPATFHAFLENCGDYSNIITYSWDFGDGTTASQQVSQANANELYSGSDVVHDYSQSGTYTVTVTATDNNASETRTSQIVIPTFSINANARSTGPISVPATTCDPVQFTAWVNGCSGVLYHWDFGDGSPILLDNPYSRNYNDYDLLYHTYSNNGTYTVTVTATEGTASAATTLPVVIRPALTLTATSPTASTTAATPVMCSRSPRLFATVPIFRFLIRGILGMAQLPPRIPRHQIQMSPFPCSRTNMLLSVLMS